MIKRAVLFATTLLLTTLGAAQTITAESAIAIDAASGKVLYQRNQDEELYPASTTKIMTALLLMEHRKPEDIIVAPPDVTRVKESTMHLKPNEKVPMKDMLYALMLRSANDGCYAVAVNIAGSVPKFSEMMNARAQELGCTHTHFDNPNGLNDRLHYTTAHDLALIAREAMHYEMFRDIVRTERTTINRGSNWQDTVMVNHNKILRRDPTCDGIKTGWTIPAGHCFVGTASREGWRVITVVLKSKSWENDTEELFNWSYGNFIKTDEIKAGEPVGEAPVLNAGVEHVPMIASADAYTLTAKEKQPSSTHLVQTLPKLVAPIEKNQKLGDLLISDADGCRQHIPLLSAGDIPAHGFGSALAQKGGSGSRLWMGAGLIMGAMYIRGRTRRRILRVPPRRKAR